MTFWRQDPPLFVFFSKPNAHSQSVSPTGLRGMLTHEKLTEPCGATIYSCFLPICAVLSRISIFQNCTYTAPVKQRFLYHYLVRLRRCSHCLPAWGKQRRINQSALNFQKSWTESQIIKLLWPLCFALALESPPGNIL